LAGPTEHFDPGQNPSLFLNAGSNYADTGGMKAAVPGTDLYNALQSDESTRNLQGIAKVAALVGGGAALGATPWGSAPVGGAAPAAGGVVEGADALTPITLPASASYISPIAAGVGMPGEAAIADVGTGSGGGGIFSRLFGSGGSLSGLGNVAGLTPQPSAPATASFATRSGGGMNIPTSVQILLRSAGNAGGLQRQMEAQRVASLL